MNGDPFASPKRRISRAKEKIAELKSAADSFFDGKPHTPVIEVNSKGFEEHKIRMIGEIQNLVTDLAYEAIEALRSSLDQAMYPIAIACGVRRVDHIHFPFADSPTEFENVMRGRVKELPPDILTLLRAFKPYKTGNTLLWALNCIRRQGTYRLIVPATLANAGTLIQHIRMTTSTPLDIPEPLTWDNEKNEMVFAVTIPGADLHYNLSFTFYVAFGDVEGVAGHPVVSTLDAFSSIAERIVLAIEAESRRLGLI